MARNRFHLILSALHFVNNDTADKSDRLYKIRDFLTLTKSRFCLNKPTEPLSIDELLQKFEGRLSWKQYIPSKRARYGIKNFLVCEASTSYVYNFIIYTGKDTLSQFHPSDACGRLYLSHHLRYFATKLVLLLVMDLKGKGHTIVVDNYFTSFELIKRCIECGFDVYGTVNKCRKDLPRIFMEKNVEKGELVATGLSKEGHNVSLFRNSDPERKSKKTVNLISKVHDASFVEKTTRIKSTNIPQVIEDCNSTMGGV